MIPTKEDIDIIENAKKYPFDTPTYSYIFINGNELRILKLDINSLTDSIIQTKDGSLKFEEYLSIRKLNFNSIDYIPVLAYGSNSSINQLHRKFLDFKEDIIIPVIKAKLIDFDIVYSAHFASYGSIPGTIEYSPKTEVDIFITYLTRPQIKHMHKSEKLGVNYCFGRLNNIQLVLENKSILNYVFFYLSLHNCLVINGSQIALSSISARNRIFPQKNEVEIIAMVRDITDKDKNLDTYIIEIVKNVRKKEVIINKLRPYSKKFSYENWEIIE